MRVLHVSGDTGTGGVETFLLTLAKWQHLDPEVVHEFAFSVEGPACTRLKEAGGVVHQLPLSSIRRPVALLKARGEFSRMLRARQYQVVVFHQYAHLIAAYADVARRSGAKTVRYFHNEIDLRYWLERVVHTFRKWLIVDSIFDSRFLQQATPTYCGTVAYYPVDARESFSPGQKAELRDELGAPEDVPVIIQVCRMAERKGHMRLLRALAQLRSVHWRCWIVGGPSSTDSEYYRGLQAFCSESGLSERVSFLGTRQDVSRLLACADIFCHPNLPPPEPFGIVFVEALQAGLPVITTAMGGPLEIVSPGCGVLFPDADDGALVQALARLLVDPQLRGEMSLAARHRGESFSPEVRLHELNAALRSGL